MAGLYQTLYLLLLCKLGEAKDATITCLADHAALKHFIGLLSFNTLSEACQTRMLLPDTVLTVSKAKKGSSLKRDDDNSFYSCAPASKLLKLNKCPPTTCFCADELA